MKKEPELSPNSSFTVEFTPPPKNFKPVSVYRSELVRLVQKHEGPIIPQYIKENGDFNSDNVLQEDRSAPMAVIGCLGGLDLIHFTHK
jgi:hypothetical protein